ncbi:LacI family DNA-binding transcriptional regulator [Liquorilactobacillus sicerae]|uniref:LacI family DNA-binding transcriptional regulator n=1 Tax=Liquorilactobacillus sicerae TaxID=1416943 RepID=UPI002480B83D|nr:LacI family DNA-binding transcriptional regulator [Liquorilactobacillus sicerae]
MASLKQIAEKAHVSISTVSRILNYDETLSVTQETRIRVFKAAEEFNYTKPIRKKKRKKVAVVTWYTEAQELKDSYYLSIRLAVESILKQLSISITRIFSDGVISNIKNCNGAILIGHFSSNQYKLFKDLNKNIVVIGENTIKYNISCVSSDNEVSIKNVLDYFITNKRTNIGIFVGNGRTNDGLEKIYDYRLGVFRKYLKSKHLYKAKNVFEGAVSTNNGYKMANEAYEELKNEFPNAILVASDTMAVGVLRFMHDYDIKVPERVAIMSFNDSPTAQFSTPSLSSIKVFTDVMAKRGVDLLTDRLTNDSKDAQISECIIVGTVINYRESSNFQGEA